MQGGNERQKPLSEAIRDSSTPGVKRTEPYGLYGEGVSE